jgi:hypothetical protein
VPTDGLAFFIGLPLDAELFFATGLFLLTVVFFDLFSEDLLLSDLLLFFAIVNR